MSALSLQDRVCVVTGATGGMGQAIVAALAEAGAVVVATDRDRAALDALGIAHCVAGDITDSAVVDELFALAASLGPLRAAVNAAAIEFEMVPLHECSDADYERMMDVNVRSVFACMRAELATMRAHGEGGSVVNIASTNSFRPQGNQPVYTAAKHAVLGLTRSAAYDYSPHGIRVNAICPGAIDTPMLRSAMHRRGREEQDTARRLSRLGRFGTPHEIAEACLWLCSDASSFTTGHALAVDGGMLGS
jgi:NAD(P)-dependent dehydrogenase (short-subunit alcohol dehydrogenase family)